MNLQIREAKSKVPNLKLTILDRAQPTAVSRVALLWSRDTDAGYSLSLQLSQRINDNDTSNNATENM